MTDLKCRSPTGNQSLQFLMQNPQPVEKPLHLLNKYAGTIIQIDFSNNINFGFERMVFAGQIGIMVPVIHLITIESLVDRSFSIERDVRKGRPEDNITRSRQQKLYLFYNFKNVDSYFMPVGIELNNNSNGSPYITSIRKTKLRNELSNGTPLPLPLSWVYT